MKKFLFTTILLLASIFILATEITDVYHFGGAGDDGAFAVKTDNQNNVYLAGQFSATMTIGDETFTSNGDTDIYLIKMDSNGNVIWATTAGSADDDNIYEVVIDEDYNVFVSGAYSGTMALDEITLTASGDTEAFVAKFDSNGTCQWANTSSGSTGAETLSYALSMDNNGDFVITGEYSNTISFGDTSFSSIGQNDIFVAKISASGEWIWANTGGSDSSFDGGEDIAFDSSNNVYVIGHFREDGFFGDIEVPEVGTVGIFLAQLNSSGEWQWVEAAGGNSIDMGFGVVVNSNDEVFITGFYKDDANFGDISISSTGDYDAFVAKYADGDWQWAVTGGSAEGEISYGMTLDMNEDIIITGRYWLTASFGEHSITSNGDEDWFCAKVDSDGEWQWALGGGGADQDNAFSVTTDYYNQIYFTGYFNGTATFGDEEITSNGGTDFALVKASQPIPLMAEFSYSDTSGYAPFDVSFTDESTGDVVSWEWDFDNDGTIDSEEQDPTWTYEEAGTYSVSLTVSNETDSDEIMMENIIEVYSTDVEQNITVTPDSLIFLDSETIAEGIEVTIENLIPLQMQLENLEFFWEETFGYHTEPYDIEFPQNLEMNEPFSIIVYPNQLVREEIVHDSLRFTINEQYITIPITIDQDLVDSNYNDSEFAELMNLSFYPNPFNPVTNIFFNLPRSSEVKINILNIRGQLVKTVVNEEMASGEHTLQWNGKDSNMNDVSSGIYFAIVQTEEKVITKKLVLLK